MLQGQTLVVIKDTPQERISERKPEEVVEIVGVPTPRILEKTVEVIDAPVPLFQEDIVEGIQLILAARE